MITSRKIYNEDRFNWDEAEYPLLGVSNVTGMVVLFNKKMSGTVVSFPSQGYSLGDYYDCDYVMSNFEPLKGSLVLNNNLNTSE